LLDLNQSTLLLVRIGEYISNKCSRYLVLVSTSVSHCSVVSIIHGVCNFLSRVIKVASPVVCQLLSELGAPQEVVNFCTLM